MEDVSERQLEIEALSLLFSSEEYTVENNLVKVRFEVDEVLGTICLTLPEDYPKSPPLVDILVENKPKMMEKVDIAKVLLGVAEKSISSNLGYPCIFSTVEDIKQFIASGEPFAQENKFNDGIIANNIGQNTITYEQFMEWTSNFIQELIERGDLPPDKNSGKQTGKEIFEKLPIYASEEDEFSEFLYTNSPEISDFDEDSENSTNCLN